jgi:hypothetical protein
VPPQAAEALPDDAAPAVRDGAVISYRRGNKESDDPSEKSDSFDIVLATETPVRERAFDWDTLRVIEYESVLSMDGADISRMNNAPFLLQHSPSVHTTLGVVTNPRIENGKLVATVRGSLRAEMQGFLQDIEAGILRQVSLGANPVETTWTERANSVPLATHVRWQGLEGSLVAIGADPNAVTRALRAQVQPDNKPAEPQNEGTDEMKLNVKDAFEFIRRAERLGIDSKTAESLIDAHPDATLDMLTGVAHQRAAASAKPAPSSVGDNETMQAQAVSEGITLAIMRRANPDNPRIKAQFEANEKAGGLARQFAGMSLRRMAEQMLSLDGINTRNMDETDIARMAVGMVSGDVRERQIRRAATGHGIGSFPNVLANTVSRVIADGYEFIQPTYMLLGTRQDLPDFRETNFVRLSDMPTLRKVGENGEIKRAVLRDAKSGMRLARYGLIIGISYEAIINDDLGAFSDLSNEFVDIARETEADVAWAPIIGNDAFADDSVDFFHEDHGNISDVAERPNAATLTDAQRLMLAQRAKGSTDGQPGRYLRLTPRTIFTGTQLFGDAQRSLNDRIYPTSPTGTMPEALRGQFAPPVCEPRLDALNAGLSWLVTADTSRRAGPIKYGFLRGQERPVITSREGFEVEGVEIKASHSFGAGLYDYRGAVLFTAAE